MFRIALFLALISFTARAEDAAPPSEERSAGGNEKMRYFLVGPKKAEAPANGYKLLLILPGGDGSAEFRPFCANIAANALSDDYLVAQLVAPKWRDKPQIVWPTEKSREAGMKFTTEAFIDAVVNDVKDKHQIDDANVFALAWSSGGPAIYAAALRPKTPLAGAFIAMSVFQPASLPAPPRSGCRAYYLLHSPQDFIKMTHPENARRTLTKAGCKVELQTYEGGHGWHGDVFGNIRAGVEWLERNSAPATQPSSK